MFAGYACGGRSGAHGNSSVNKFEHEEKKLVATCASWDLGTQGDQMGF